MNDNDSAACHFDLGQNVRGKQDRVLFAEIFDELANLPNLIWIETDCWLVEDEKIGLVQERISQTYSLPITLRERTD